MMNPKRKAYQSQVPTASLADIAFLLIIFFLVTTTIDVDKGIGLTLPRKGETRTLPKNNVVRLLINEHNEILLDKEEVVLAALRNKVRQKLEQNPIIVFSIETHAKADYQTYIALLDQLKQAGAHRISFAGEQQ